MFRKAGLIFVLSVFLSGCGTLMPYKTEFQCKSPDKGKCATVKAAYDESKKDIVDIDAGVKSKEEKKEENDKRHTRFEYNFSSFSRSFTLPEMVVADKIDAVYDNGELKVMLPKKEEAKKALLSKHVPVK